MCQVSRSAGKARPGGVVVHVAGDSCQHSAELRRGLGLVRGGEGDEEAGLARMVPWPERSASSMRRLAARALAWSSSRLGRRVLQRRSTEIRTRSFARIVPLPAATRHRGRSLTLRARAAKVRRHLVNEGGETYTGDLRVVPGGAARVLPVVADPGRFQQARGYSETRSGIECGTWSQVSIFPVPRYTTNRVVRQAG